MKKAGSMKKALLLVLGMFLLASSNTSLNAQELSSKEAYDKMMEELKTLEHGVSKNSSMDEIIAVFDKIEAKLVRFVDQYPQSMEALEAKFQLGMLNNSINKSEKVKKYLGEYIASADKLPRERVAYAHFFLAEAYKNNEEFKQAKKYYKKFLDSYSDIDKSLTTKANNMLADIDVLSRLATGNKPIPFMVKDINGKELSLDKYKGKVVLLDFWATWCGPCRVEMPNVIKLYNKYHNKGFEIIGISLDNRKSPLESYIKENGITWPQYFDGKGWGNELAKKYKIRSIPATFLIDRKGKIRYKSVRGRQLASAVEKLLREN